MTTWSNNTQVEEADACSFCEARATFILSDELFAVIHTLCKEVRSEWQMLLIGEERDNHVVYANDYYIPKQTVTAASVTNNECFDLQRIQDMGIVIGIHSHGSMKAWFSKTDHDCANTSPIKNNIVVNNDQDFVGVRAITLPCGMVKFIDADVVRDIPAIQPVDKVRGVKHIETKKYVSPSPAHIGFGNTAFCNAGYNPPALKGTRKKHAFDMDDTFFGYQGGMYAD